MELPKAFRTALADRYLIESEIGSGNMATTFLASDLRHSRHVAVKVLRPDANVALSDVRFVREIKFLAQLQHPNIVPLHDSGHACGYMYYVMPYIRGETLRARMDSEPRLPVRDAIRIVCQIAEALDYAHRHGVIHRDVKPENIVLSGGHALIMDFGIARAIGVASGQQLTTVRSIGPGTPAYMSPEQMIPGQELDGRSDIYSLATVLYEALVGELPFRDKDGRTDTLRKLRGTPPRIRDVRGDVPESIDRAMLRAMAPAASDRFSSALEFANALTAPETAQPEGRPRSAPGDAVKPERDRRMLIAAGIAGTLVLATLIALAMSGRLG